jgi:glycosidase
MWAREAIWYQIFVERFRNGNPNNNPSRETCEGALVDSLPLDWSLTPWGHNWYEQEEWAVNTGLPFDRTIQMRRYGGDLKGVQDKIEYLKDLGVTVIYFNPINDAPSLHKYDARYYHHIDVTFGESVALDRAIMAQENPVDPNTWQWTSADKKWLETVDMLHDAGMKVVLDFSWNHTGIKFWAFDDLKKNKLKSNYKDWYHNVHFSKGANNEDTFSYDGWYGISTLPELRKISLTGKKQGRPYEGDLDPYVKNHIFAVSKRWIDPHGDGSCRSGIDGMRLDVAEHVPMGFWRDFRKYVRSINKEFYLVGENWWDQWPDKLMDPMPWVQGDVFDAVMHYQWYKVARAYFGQSNEKIDLKTFKQKMDSIFCKYPSHTQQAMMNLASSHDSPRLITDFYNSNRYKMYCKPQEDPNFKTEFPDEVAVAKVKLLLFHQFTFVGSPHIWNGDELGMTGADDPDNRKPIWWEDIDFEEETQSPYASYHYQQKPSANLDIFKYYKNLIKLRKENKLLSYGAYRFVDTENEKVLGYMRELVGSKVLVLINNSAVSQPLSSNLMDLKKTIIFSTNKSNKADQISELQPYSAYLFQIN